MTSDIEPVIDHLLRQAPVLPVVSISRLADAVPLARALVDGGLPVLEITLRSDVALAAIEAIASQVPDAVVGAGTVLTGAQLASVTSAGARFAIAPGATEVLYDAMDAATIPFLPAIASASELMRGLERGHRRFKFFPATAAGGLSALRAFAGPFPQVRFCPTGGIDAASAPDFLALANVITVGGSWMLPASALAAGDWAAITGLARAAAGIEVAAAG